MKMFDHFLTNFTAGELSPNMLGRTDVDRYYNGCLTLENFIVLPTGGVVRRPGTRFVSEVKDSSKQTRLIPFIFSNEQSYILEFGDHYMRVSVDGGHIIHTTSTTGPWAVSTAYKAYDYVNNGGLVYRCILNHTSATDNEPGVGANWETYWVQDDILEIYSPYASEDLDLIKYAQSADVLFMVHPDYPPQKLSRLSNTSWKIENFEFKNGPFLDECYVQGTGTCNSSITISGGTGQIGDTVTVTASNSIFTDTDINRWIKVRYVVEAESLSSGVHTGNGTSWASSSWEVDGEWEFRATFANSPAGDLWYLQFSIDGGTTWRNYYAIDDRINTTIEGEAKAEDLGASSGVLPKFRIYTDSASSEITWNFRVKRSVRAGYIKITGYTSPTQVTGTLMSTLNHLDQPTYSWALGAWSYTTGFPRSITFHDGRLWFGGTYTTPNRIWASKTDDYADFDIGEGEATDALDLQPIASEVNTAIWLVSKGNMIVGTAGDEWVLDGSNVSPDNPPKLRRETNFGSEDIQAVVANGYAVFVQKGGKTVRHIQYDWASDTYYAFDLTVMSDHICGDGIECLSYLKSPWSSVWGKRKDGVLLGLTYVPEHKVYSWHRHITSTSAGQSFVESIAAIPGELWLVVKRTINGEEKRYIEYIVDWDGTLDNSVYADCAAQYLGAPTTTISGLSYLEGETVAVVADGKYIGDRVVSNGTITLDDAASNVWVGLNYTSTLKTINIEHATPPETTQGVIRRTVHAILRLVNTVGGYVGFDESDVRRIPYVGKSGNPLVVQPSLFSGDTQPILVDAPSEYGQYITIVQDEPYPMGITAIILRLVLP
jgi:hypothetical protein